MGNHICKHNDALSLLSSAWLRWGLGSKGLGFTVCLQWKDSTAGSAPSSASELLRDLG